MNSLRIPVAALLFAASSLVSGVHAADRVALVIGCGKYRAEGVPELSTPVNDARKMAGALRAAPLGFDVVEAFDPTRNQFFEKLDEFQAHARRAKVVLFYYSGHGIEADGVNYLIPVDAVLEKPSHLESEGIDFDRVLSAMRGTGAAAKVAILDACRNNPFGHTKSWRDNGKGVSDGVLAALGEAQVAEATLVCFATSPGRKAAAVLDDTSENSPFTEFLLRRLATPGAKLRDVFESTADDVAQATKNHQLPYVKYDGSASVLRQLVLVPGTPGMETAKLEPLKLVLPTKPVLDPLAAATKAEPFVNSLGLEFVPVPGTKALFCRSDTRVRDWQAFVREAGDPTSGGLYSMRVKKASKVASLVWELDPAASWKKPGFAQTSEHPVVGVSWVDAHRFCAWLSKREERTYRLPTDEEWSAAVGSEKYPWGSQWPPPPGVGNYGDQKFKASLRANGWGSGLGDYNDGYERTSPVGSFKENRWGLFDMGGNVWQWCEDEYRPSMNDDEVLKTYPLFNSEKTDDGTPYHVLRGASWFNSAEIDLRSSFHSRIPPADRYGALGFRCVLVVPDS